MGSGTSKSSSSSGTVADRGSRGSKISCLWRSSGYISDDDHVSVSVSVETGKSKSVKPVDETKKKSYFKCDRAQEGISSICSDASSSSIQTHVTRNHGSHSCLRFGFVPRSISSRLHKAVSLGSSGSCSIFYGTPLESIDEGDYHANSGPNITGDRTEGWQVSNLLASQQFQGPSGMSGLQVVLHDQQIISSSEVARRGTNTMSESTTQGHCSSNHEEIDNTGTRLIENWVSGHESLERSMRFSRARSVGRLRDRVLCRTSSSEGVLGYSQEDREARDSRLGNMRPFCNSASRGASSSRDVETSPASNRLHPCTFSSRNNSLDCDTSSSTEARNYTDVEHRVAFLERGRIRSQGRALQRLGSQIENLSGHDRSCVLSGQHVTGQCLCQARGRTSELNSDTNARANFDTPSSTEARNYTVHRSDFLERRRRIRSQVRALQRLDSRVENLAGHDRACILSGQHITSRCICQASGRASNQNRDPNVRASISRILLLAEALFEVLDEIHQQSAVLSSRPSVGSVPAPKEVVDCMPVKIYTKPLEYENEEAAQCYICLVEYEEGDFMRILPCHHEFHQTCIDRWLKEIHRVCPLCRGDVCHPDSPL